MLEYDEILKINKHLFPFGDYAARLLSSIFEASLFCFENRNDYTKLYKSINKYFDWIIKTPFADRRIDLHLKEGLHEHSLDVARLSRLTVQAFKEAQDQNEYYFTSPLNVLYHALSIPDFPQSYAYSLAICRTLLFIRFKVHPKHKNLPENWVPFDTDEIKSALIHFRRFTLKNDNFDLGTSDPVKLMVAHFLAMKGILRLRFGTVNEVPIESTNGKIKIIKKYFKSCDVNGGHDNYDKLFEFRLSSDYTDLPDASEILNELCGIPIPIRGADTIFFGGLRTSDDSSLVISISGKAGTGKTSLGLALAANLSPFNTLCYYISLEESAEDLNNRIGSLVPDYLQRLSIFNETISDWFKAEKVKIPEGESKIIAFKDTYIDAINHLVKSNSIAPDKKSIPSICPLIVVIDSITGLLGNNFKYENYSTLNEFISECRKLGVIVILISGNELPAESKIDYLVDIVIQTDYENTGKFDKKPQRVLQLLKTRHQISRPGSHLFHLSGAEGFRISPQLPSQLDRKQNIKRPIHNKRLINNILNLPLEDKKIFEKTLNYQKFVDIFKGSQILIHGQGSSGKAGLGLKILMSPFIKDDKLNDFLNRKIDFNSREYKHKILVVSFLYPKEYYINLENRISTLFTSQSKNKAAIYPNLIEPEIQHITFYPGFLSPEDFINKVSRYLDTAIQNGEPYTGILLDGIHNVFLQFPLLQERDMVWPMLYNMLLKYKLTIVTTFTTFNIEDEKTSKNYDLFLRGHAPVLHAMVQATDYYLYLEPSPANDVLEYILSIKSAINQKVPNYSIKWDRNSLIIENQKFSSQKSITFPDSINEKNP